ncbi:MAG: TRAM domain-containing protein [Trueperella sp.]|nr:TRAM domain-containing protein [Trueperella sp.]
MKLKLVDIAHGGSCVARADDGRVVFVRGGIPGETVSVQLTAERAKLAHALVTEVLVPSPYRIPHKWAVGAAGETGAADFGHIEYKHQLTLKTQVVRQNIRRIAGAALAEEMPAVEVNAVAGEEWATRTRFECVKLDTGAGMYREASHQLIPVDQMMLAVSDIATDIFTDRWDEQISAGTRVKVVHPVGGNNVVVTERGAFYAPGVPGPKRIRETATDGVKSYEYQISPGGFWQIHYRAPSELLSLVMAGVQPEPGMKICELYSGAGLFSVPLAQAVGEQGRLISVEGSASAVKDARYNLRSYPWARAERGRVTASRLAGLVEDADVIVADPPRSGLGAQLAQYLGKLAAPRIVLVSCDPAAMARDVANLVNAGRTVTAISARDIFPQTHHMEIVTVLSR